KEKYEIIFFNYTKKYLNREGVISLNVNYDDKNDLLLTDHYPWNKIFKRELFKGISFPNENIRYTDHAIIPALLAKAQRVGFLEENLYFYDFSHSNNISKRTDKRDDIYISCDHLYKYYEKGFLSEKEIEIIFIKTFIFDKLFNIDNLKLKDIYYNNLKVEKYLNEKIPNWSSSKCLSYSFTKRYKHNIKNPYIRIFVGNIFKKSNKLSSLLLYVLYFFKCTYKKLLKL
ncbi:MAG: hypothetical protein ACOCRK_07665, partial [bacterium]